MRNTLYTIAILLGITLHVQAQQVSLNSQYLFNEYILNPGAVGSKDYTPVQLNFRKQWTNFPGAPTTQFLTAHGKVANKMGIGANIYNDLAGPSRRTGITFSGAYHLQLDKAYNHKLGFGLGLSLTQHFIDVNKLDTYIDNDPTVLKGFNNQFVPDANAGIFYHYKNKGFAGISAYNMVEKTRDLFNFYSSIYSPLVRHYYFLGGYHFEITKNFGIKPTVMVQAIEAGVFQFDGTLLFTFNKYFWIGASYRHNADVVGLIGGQVGPLKFGYSYDYTLSDIARYSNGSHEVFLELQIRTKKTDDSSIPWLKRNRIYNTGN
jgi:type IX secretion system PorP/SprF family membrane protein